MLLEATENELTTTQIDEYHRELHKTSMKPRTKRTTKGERNILDEFFGLEENDG